jgi:uncharacterized membrane protein YjgN (DUF898 family)
MGRSRSFTFNGGAGTYFGTGLLAFAITVLSLGIAYPYALVLRQRWRAKHTYVNGHRLVFVGTGIGLFGLWIKWLLLSVITFGVYLLWVVARIQKWVVENTDFDPTFSAGPAYSAPGTASLSTPSPPLPPPATQDPTVPQAIAPAPAGRAQPLETALLPEAHLGLDAPTQAPRPDGGGHDATS